MRLFAETAPNPAELAVWVRVFLYILGGISGVCGAAFGIGKFLEWSVAKIRSKTGPTQQEFDCLKAEVERIKQEITALKIEINQVHAENMAGAEGRANKLQDRLQALCDALEKKQRK